MKRIVVLTRHYKPYNSAVGICMGNVLQCLDDVEVHVICEKTRLHEPIEEQIDGEHIHRFVSPQTNLRNECLEKASRASSWISRNLWKAAFRAVRAAYNAAFLLGSESVQRGLSSCYLAALEELPFRPDLIVPTCMPIESLVACWQFCRKRSGVRYVPVLFDRFADNETLHRFALNKRLKYRRNQRVEQQVLSSPSCAAVLYVDSWGSRVEFMDQIAPAHRIEHPLLVKRETRGEAVFEGGRINIVYAGTLTKAGRDPSYALRLVGASEAGIPATLHVFGMGDAMPLVEKFAEGHPGLAQYHGVVSSEYAQAAVSGSDVLLSIGNRDIAQTPSKIFEYMATGKPIIHIAKTVDDPANAILMRYPLGLVLMEDDALFDDQANQMRYYIANHRSDTVDFSEVARLFAPALPCFTAELLTRYW